MTPLRHLPRRLGLLAAGAALFIAFVYLFFPTARINQMVSALLSDQGLSLAPGCRKTLLPGLAWERPVLSSGKGALLKFDALNLRPRLLPLLTGRPAFAVSALIGKGRLETVCGLRGSEALALQASGISLAEIPFFATVLGARAGGELWSEGRLTRTAGGVGGEIRLEVKQLALSGVRLGSFPLPDVDNLRTRGMVRVTGGAARLESFSLEGDGIYMRLSGEIPSGPAAATQPLNLTLEIMPRAEFMERQKLVFLLLAKFAASPGVYRVPIRGTLLKPEIV